MNLYNVLSRLVVLLDLGVVSCTQSWLFNTFMADPYATSKRRIDFFHLGVDFKVNIVIEVLARSYWQFQEREWQWW